MPGTETNTKYIFLIINHSITVYQKYKDEESKEGRQSVKRPGWRRKLLYMRANTHIILYEPECISKGRINKNTLWREHILYCYCSFSNNSLKIFTYSNHIYWPSSIASPPDIDFSVLDNKNNTDVVPVLRDHVLLLTCTQRNQHMCSVLITLPLGNCMLPFFYLVGLMSRCICLLAAVLKIQTGTKLDNVPWQQHDSLYHLWLGSWFCCPTYWF